MKAREPPQVGFIFRHLRGTRSGITVRSRFLGTFRVSTAPSSCGLWAEAASYRLRGLAVAVCLTAVVVLAGRNVVSDGRSRPPGEFASRQHWNAPVSTCTVSPTAGTVHGRRTEVRTSAKRARAIHRHAQRQGDAVTWRPRISTALAAPWPESERKSAASREHRPGARNCRLCR